MPDTFKTPEAKREYYRQWYQRNKERHKANVSAYNKEYRTKGCWDRLGPLDLQLIKEHSESMRPSVIARELGVYRTAVTYHIKKNDWPRYNPQSVK